MRTFYRVYTVQSVNSLFLDGLSNTHYPRSAYTNFKRFNTTVREANNKAKSNDDTLKKTESSQFQQAASGSIGRFINLITHVRISMNQLMMGPGRI